MYGIFMGLNFIIYNRGKGQRRVITLCGYLEYFYKTLTTTWYIFSGRKELGILVNFEVKDLF